MRAMLKEFSKKKDKVLMDKFKQNQAVAASLTSMPGAAANKKKTPMQEKVYGRSQ